MKRKQQRKIFALLAAKGIKLIDVAAIADVSVAAVSGPLNGHWESRPVQIACAKALGMDQVQFDKIWK